MRELAGLFTLTKEINIEDFNILLMDKKLRSVLIDGFSSVSKPCPRPNCQGFLKARSANNVETVCESCHGKFCYACTTPFHVGRSCQAARLATDRWRSFLEIASVGSDASELSDEVVGSLRSRLDEMANSETEYLRTQVRAGLVKKCTSCSRLIRDPVVDCGKVKCGGDSDRSSFNPEYGCGNVMDWRGHPAVSEEDLSELSVNAVEGVTLNFGIVTFSPLIL
jgi:hypothetical protein